MLASNPNLKQKLEETKIYIHNQDERIKQVMVESIRNNNEPFNQIMLESRRKEQTKLASNPNLQQKLEETKIYIHNKDECIKQVMVESIRNNNEPFNQIMLKSRRKEPTMLASNPNLKQKMEKMKIYIHNQDEHIKQVMVESTIKGRTTYKCLSKVENKRSEAVEDPKTCKTNNSKPSKPCLAESKAKLKGTNEELICDISKQEEKIERELLDYPINSIEETSLAPSKEKFINALKKLLLDTHLLRARRSQSPNTVKTINHEVPQPKLFTPFLITTGNSKNSGTQTKPRSKVEAIEAVDANSSFPDSCHESQIKEDMVPKSCSDGQDDADKTPGKYDSQRVRVMSSQSPNTVRTINHDVPQPILDALLPTALGISENSSTPTQHRNNGKDIETSDKKIKVAQEYIWKELVEPAAELMADGGGHECVSETKFCRKYG
jgi:hypothetical protein